MDPRHTRVIIELTYADLVRAARAERERVERIIAEAEAEELRRWLRVERHLREE